MPIWLLLLATMAMPPAIADCQEDRHDLVVFLQAAGARQRLLHRTTSENILLPEVPGHVWHMGFAANGFGYITAAASPLAAGEQPVAPTEPPPSPLWVNDFFKMSMWTHTQGRKVVLVKPSSLGSPSRPCWLTDIHGMTIPHYTKWDVFLPSQVPGEDPFHFCTMQCKV